MQGIIRHQFIPLGEGFAGIVLLFQVINSSIATISTISDMPIRASGMFTPPV